MSLIYLDSLTGGSVSASGEHWNEVLMTAGYSTGEQATVTATPAEGWEFVAWRPVQENPVCFQESYTFTVTENRALQAVFKRVDKTLTVTEQGNGKVVYDKKDEYTHDTSVSLRAVPDIGHHFVQWQGDISGSQTANPKSITMDDDKEVTAIFEPDDAGPPDFTLYLDMDDDGVDEVYEAGVVVPDGLFEYMREEDGQRNGTGIMSWHKTDDFQEFHIQFGSEVPEDAALTIEQTVLQRTGPGQATGKNC